MVSDLKPCTYEECKISAQRILPSTDTINWPVLGVTFLSISNTKVINFFLPGSIAHFPLTVMNACMVSKNIMPDRAKISSVVVMHFRCWPRGILTYRIGVQVLL